MNDYISNNNKLYIYSQIIKYTKLDLNNDKKNKLFILINSMITKYIKNVNQNNINNINLIIINEIIELLKKKNNNNNMYNNFSNNTVNQEHQKNNDFSRKSMSFEDINKYKLERNSIFDNKKVDQIDFRDNNYKNKINNNEKNEKNVKEPDVFLNEFTANETFCSYSNLDDNDNNIQIDLTSYNDDETIEERLSKLKNNRNMIEPPKNVTFIESIDPKDQKIENKNMNIKENYNNNQSNDKINSSQSFMENNQNVKQINNDQSNIAKALLILAEKINDISLKCDNLEQKFLLIQK
jgi:hypothetical protein